MREPFPLSGWLVIGLLVAVAVFLLTGRYSQATSTPFTLTEIDPHSAINNGQWQYRASTNIDIDTASLGHHTDSPWWWRHYSDDRWDFDINCDNTRQLFPADPNSPDTNISTDGQTVTVNIYQRIDNVWVCFAVECEDGTFAYGKIRNLQTQATINSGPCGQDPPGSGSSPPLTPTDQPVSTPNQNQELDPINENVNEINGGQGQGGPDEADGQSDENQNEGEQQDQQGQNDQDGNGQNDQAGEQDGQSANGQNDQDNQNNQPPGDQKSQPSGTTLSK